MRFAFATLRARLVGTRPTKTGSSERCPFPVQPTRPPAEPHRQTGATIPAGVHHAPPSEPATSNKAQGRRSTSHRRPHKSLRLKRVADAKVYRTIFIRHACPLLLHTAADARCHLSRDYTQAVSRVFECNFLQTCCPTCVTVRRRRFSTFLCRFRRLTHSGDFL